MRVLLFAATLLGLVSAAPMVTRQGYFNGTAGLGLCGTPNPLDVATVAVGVCTNSTDAADTHLSSFVINDCTANGLITMTKFNNTDKCDLDKVQELITLGEKFNNINYCNPDNDGKFATYICSEKPTPLNSYTYVNVTAYPVIAPFPADHTCNGATFPIPPFQSGKCTAVQASATASYGILAECVNGLVTAVFYDNPTCTITFNGTSYNNTFVVPIGPFNQFGSIAAVGKNATLPGSSCGLIPNFAFITATCYTLPTTIPPTSPATNPPTTPSNTTQPPKGAASSTTVGLAALLVAVVAQLF